MGNIQEEIKILEIKEDLYSYEGTISKLNISTTFKPTIISFKALPTRHFLWPGDKELCLNIQIGTRVQVKYEEHIVKSYSHFWIKSIKISDNKEETIYKRNHLSNSKHAEESPTIKCLNCGNLCALSNFKQCEGVIEKNFWKSFPYCNQCYSVSDDKHIGNNCIRETILCNNCNSIRKI